MAVVGNLLKCVQVHDAANDCDAQRRRERRAGLIEIQDHCGGIPSVDLPGLFDAFEQRGADRTGLGIGLAFSRWAVEANQGCIYARNVPVVGCVFTVDFPRVPTPVRETTGTLNTQLGIQWEATNEIQFE